MEDIVLPEPVDMAKRLIKEIIYDNGTVDRFNPETEALYPEHHVKRIAVTAGVFFGAHPELWNDEDIENITAGEYYENESLYAEKLYYRQLHDSINDYFNREV